MAAGKLIVQSITGKDLPVPRGITSFCCGLKYDGQKKRTSRADPHNPRWHEKFEFVINDTGMPGVLKITIRTHTSADPCGPPTYTYKGNVTIPISTVPQRPDRWYPIKRRPYFIQGDLGIDERRLVTSVTKAARDAEKRQMQLRDMEQNAYRVYLDLIEKQNKERMEVFKTFQREEEQLLNLWAASRRETLDIVRGIESGSQPLVETLNTLVETTRKYERKLEAEMVRVLGGEAAEEISVPSKSECQICFDRIEGSSSGTSKARKQRSCLTPCNHAMICLPCATGIWESTKSCPFCKVVLTTKPRALYLG